MEKPLLEMNHVFRRVGNQVALQDVSLAVYAGEVIGLADRAGVSKSFLVAMLSGLQAPDSGMVVFSGRVLQWPFQNRAIGIEIIYQEPILADDLDVTSNIFLGHELSRSLLLPWLQIPDQRKMDERADQLLATLDVRLPSLHQKVAALSGEQRQLIAIAQVLGQPAQLIVVDNPGRMLSHPYQEKLLQLIRNWQKQGIAVLFSSTNLDHLFAVSDRIIVLRDGLLAANLPTDKTNREDVVAATVGTADREQRTPVIWALDSYFRAREQAETLRHNQTLLERDLAAQGNLNQQLVARLADQVKALDSANLALQDAQRRLLTEREQERKHLARELHDQMLQDLLSLSYQLEEIEEKATALPDLAEDVGDIRQHIGDMVEDVRRICGNLRPPTIDSLGLGSALQSYAHDWQERTGIEVALSLDSHFGRLPEALELSIFRIIQESLSNVRKHAQASQVIISLRHTSPRLLLISIADNGQGLSKSFDLAALGQAGHYGLLGVSERVALMGGRLNYQNQRDGGLLLQVEIPHPRVEKTGYET